MTPDSTHPIPRLLRTVLVAVGTVAALGAGAETAGAEPAAIHHRHHQAHHGYHGHHGHYPQHYFHSRRLRRYFHRHHPWHYFRSHHLRRYFHGRRLRHRLRGYDSHRLRHGIPVHYGFFARHGYPLQYSPYLHRGYPAPHGDQGGRPLPHHFRYGTEPAIRFALAHLGDGYSYGGNGPHWWDCSGLVQQAYRRAGIRLPRVASAQYRAAIPIHRSQLHRGDLVFWSNNGRSSGIHHVAVYLGQGRYVEAPRPGRRVRVSSFALYRPTMYARV